MENNTMHEILNYAIDREREAVRFYQDLQKIAKFKNQIEMLKNIENMEKGHIEVLQNIKSGKITMLKIEDVIDLKISDYLVKKEPTPNMDFQDILIIAMKREEAATKLYKNLSEVVVNKEIKKLFERLSAEEANHKIGFEDLYDKYILTDN